MKNQIELLKKLGMQEKHAIDFMKSSLSAWMDFAKENIDDEIDLFRIIDSLQKLKDIEL